MTRWLRRRWGADDGFTIVEAMVAVTILSLAIVLTIQPVMAALRRVSDARVIGIAENLAQAEVESIRALNYDDVGIPGRTPSGVLQASRQVDVEGRTYTVETNIEYAGSITGLAIIPQGGDGVEGTWDPGVDYKVVEVTVYASGREDDPITMESIVSPPRIGAHEGIANARVTVVRHEPFQSSTLALPTLKITSPPSPAIASVIPADQQVFPAIPVGDYTIELNEANGWIIHPDDVLAMLDRITVSAGATTEVSIRVYRAATLDVTVQDLTTGLPIDGARVTLTHVPSGGVTAGAPGQYTFSGLIPDAYDVLVTATGYYDWSVTSINVPTGYADDMVHELTANLEPMPPPTTTTTLPPTTTTTLPGETTTTTVPATTTTTTPPPAPTVSVTFTVQDNTRRVTAGATVSVDHPTRGLLQATTDIYGQATLDLEPGTVFTVTASTEFGHGPDQENFDPGATTSVSLRLKRPSGKGTMVLKNGFNADLLYSTGGSWVAMPANYQGEASFVAYSGWYFVGKRCHDDGDVIGEKWVRVRRNRNRSTTIWGNC